MCAAGRMFKVLWLAARLSREKRLRTRRALLLHAYLLEKPVVFAIGSNREPDDSVGRPDSKRDGGVRRERTNIVLPS